VRTYGARSGGDRVDRPRFCAQVVGSKLGVTVKLLETMGKPTDVSAGRSTMRYVPASGGKACKSGGTIHESPDSMEDNPSGTLQTTLPNGMSIQLPSSCCRWYRIGAIATPAWLHTVTSMASALVVQRQREGWNRYARYAFVYLGVGLQLEITRSGHRIARARGICDCDSQ